MFSWWIALPWKIRMGVAVLFLLIPLLLLLFLGVLWLWGWAIGAVTIFFSFPNDAEKRGYRDF